MPTSLKSIISFIDPIYSKMATPQLPTRDAPPNLVRAYFSNILTQLHDVPEAEAIEIASNWKYGRGSEISYYDIGTYRLMFGAEAGVLLYGHARRELRMGNRGPTNHSIGGAGRQKPERDMFGLTPGLTLLYLLLALIVALGWAASKETNGERAAGMAVIACVSGFVFLLVYVAYYFLD